MYFYYEKSMFGKWIPALSDSPPSRSVNGCRTPVISELRILSTDDAGLTLDQLSEKYPHASHVEKGAAPSYPGGPATEAKPLPQKLVRPAVPALDAILGEPTPVLDHGFVRVIDYMGDDAAIVQAARVSYGAGTKEVSDDRGLIRYLMRNWHSTPFEMCEIKLHVKLPVFVARQWIRHRTANVNEYSARYSILDREFYVPEPSALAAQSSTNNQGRGSVLEGAEAARVLDLLRDDAMRAYDHYEEMLTPDEETGKLGLARELARMNLPTSIYTQWYWKTDLHNLFHFLRLRADSHAQMEIRVYAEAIKQITQTWVPHAFGAWEDYREQSVNLSRSEAYAIRTALSTLSPEARVSVLEIVKGSGASKREVAEFERKMGMA